MQRVRRGTSQLQQTCVVDKHWTTKAVSKTSIYLVHIADGSVP